jgi:Mn-dependent DtxR family transcriptional regulator
VVLSKLVDWDKANKFADWLSRTVRAALGVEVDKDFYQGLMHTNDERERTKLSTRNVYRHNFLDLLTLKGGEEWEICHQQAEGERHLFIAENGERATNFINAMARKQQEQQPVPTTSITMQNVPTPEKTEKKGFFHR